MFVFCRARERRRYFMFHVSIFYHNGTVVDCVVVVVVVFDRSIDHTSFYQNQNMQMDDEYTDYSCSTPVERLARDVETELRNWHVVDGSDRHVSFASTTVTTTTTVASHNINNNNNSNNSNNMASTTIETPSGKLHTIRSSRISWTVPLAANSERVTIELTLALWDYYPDVGIIVPTPSNHDHHHHNKNNQHDRQQPLQPQTSFIMSQQQQATKDDPISKENRHILDLPQSVRRTPLTCLSNDPFANLSTLFGIGQHITLTPSSTSLHNTHQKSNTSNATAETTIMTRLAESILERHASDETVTTASSTVNKSQIAKLVVASSLSSLLQMALNLAVSNSQCCIPVFGIWGHYPSHHHATTTNASTSSSSSCIVSLLPNWMQVCQSMQLPRPPKRRVKRQPLFRFVTSSKKRQAISRQEQAVPPLPSHYNQQNVPNLFVGSVLSSSSSSSTTTSGLVDVPVTTFRFCAFPSIGKHVVTESRLSTWAFLLWQQCQSQRRDEQVRPVENKHSGDGTQQETPEQQLVILCAARHVYSWLKPRKKARSMLFANGTNDDVLREWRSLNTAPRRQKSTNPFDEDESVETYRDECRKYALSLLERACCGASADDPLWGPPDDPIASVYAIATWDHRLSSSTFSTTTMMNGTTDEESRKDNSERRQHQQNSLLTFPLRVRSRQLMTPQDWKEVETSMEQAILDPVINCSSFMVQIQYDLDTAVTTLAARLRCVLAALIRTATLPAETLLMHLTIEAVMDVWDNEAGNIVADSLAMRANAGVATRRLVTAMDWASVAEDMIEPWEAESIVRNVLDGSLSLGFPSPPDDVFDPTREQGEVSPDDPWMALPRSAPAGRLVSVLFAHLARVHAPSSMAMIWSAFVKAIRKKWDARESLPNMNYIPGIDPTLDLTGAHRRWNYTIGLKADFSSFVHCSEPDPDDNYCLIGQKLQVRMS